MTLIWFIVWVIADNVGRDEPLLLDPVNVWTATLLLAIALDLSGVHARTRSSRRAQQVGSVVDGTASSTKKSPAQ